MDALTKAVTVARERWAEPAAERVPGSGGRIQRAAQSATVISAVVIGVVALIGVLIFDQVNSAIPDDVMYNNKSTGNTTELGGAREDVVLGLGNAMELVPIVLLVLIAGLVIAVVQRMRGGNGGMM
jgi:hypothetical protein